MSRSELPSARSDGPPGPARVRVEVRIVWPAAMPSLEPTVRSKQPAFGDRLRLTISRRRPVAGRPQRSDPGRAMLAEIHSWLDG